MKLISKLLLVAFLATSFIATAQDEEEGGALTFSGSVDTYWRSTFGQEAQAPGTSFANGTGFSMGMVNLVTSYEVGKVGFVGDLVFGPRGVEAAFGDTWTGQSIVNQMYAYWNVTDKVKLTLGQWNTYLGYEVISPAANFNYSTSYMFSWGPFSQAGLKADIAVSDNFSVALAVMNPTDVLETNIPDYTKYTAGLQLGYSTDAGATFLNARYGDASGKLFQIDLTGGYDLSDAFFLGFNATYLDDDGAGFSGVALYPQVALSDDFSLGLRGEYFMVTKDYLGDGDPTTIDIIGRDANGDGSVIDLTLSANYSIGNLTLIPEIRMDMTSEDTYADGDGAPTKSLSSFLLAAVFSF
jgi:hypothetical protein